MTITFPSQFRDIPIAFRFFKTDADTLVIEVYDRDLSPNWIYSASMPIDELHEIDDLPEDENVSRLYAGSGYADYEAFIQTGELPPMPPDILK